MQNKIEKKCKLCGCDNNRLLFIKDSYPILRCCSCGLTYAYLNDNTYLQDFYNEGYFRGEKRKFGYVDYYDEREYSLYNFKKHWEKIERHISGGRVLDVGCAMGLFLECAGRNWECYGLDISKYASRIAQNRFGPTIETCQLLEAPWQDNFFDLITMWDVLDHLPDPIENVSKCYQLLKRQGILILNVGDISALFARICGKKWYIIIPPTHLYFFSVQTITATLSKIGFEIFKIERSGKWVSLRVCFFRLSYIFNNALINTIFKYVTQSRLGDIKIYINFHDIMTIYARKK